MPNLSELIYTIPAVLLALSAHEFAHGFVSYQMGDPTPKKEGRLTLNPLHHIDIVGTLCLLLFHFGWAKPVQVNPYYYKNKKQGMVNVALAGPLMNYLVAFVSIFLFFLVGKSNSANGITNYLYSFLSYSAIINLGLGTFNLIPIPPLDGSKVLGAILPESLYFKVMQIERYGTIILLILLYTNILTGPMNQVVDALLNGMVRIVGFIL